MGKKRSAGEGSVWKTDAGTWRGQLMNGFDDNGKKKIVSFKAPTRGEVLEQIRHYQTQAEEQIYLSKTLTLSAWADTWYQDYQSQVQPSTYSGYKYTLKVIKEYFGNTVLCEVMPIHINRFLDSLVQKDYSLSMIQKCRAMLIQIFKFAEDNGLVVRNVAQRAKSIKGIGKTVKPAGTKDSYTQEEVEQLMALLPDNLMGNGVRTMLGTGLRVQELIALTPEDIAEDGSTIRIDKAIKMVDGIATLGPPKSPKSVRTVPVPVAYRHAVLQMRTGGGSKYIWNNNGSLKHYSVGVFRRRFYRMLGQIEGIRQLTPHCCRHTYITLLQASGVPLETISKLAGHSHLETTGGYLHLSDQTLAQAVEVLSVIERLEVS